MGTNSLMCNIQGLMYMWLIVVAQMVQQLLVVLVLVVKISHFKAVDEEF